MRELRSQPARFLGAYLGRTILDFILLRRLRSKLLSFLRAGIGPTLLYFTLYVGLTRCVDIKILLKIHVCLEAPKITTVIIAGLLSWTLNFILQKYWAFRDHRRHIPQQAALYAAMKLGILVLQVIFLSILLRMGVLNFLLDMVRWKLSLEFHDLLAHVLIAPVLTGTTYIFTNKIFTAKQSGEIKLGNT